jgi:hypothetical protein
MRGIKARLTVPVLLLVAQGCGTPGAPAGGNCTDCTPVAADGPPSAGPDTGGAVDGAPGAEPGAALDAGVAYEHQAQVTASANLIPWKSCGATPAQVGPLAPGSYTVTLEASTLSKGGAAKDDYVIAEIPVDKQQYRYVSLNGVSDSFSFTSAQGGEVRLWFIDSDGEGNAGEATVYVNPGGHVAKVSAVTNLIEWDKGNCVATPAEIDSVPVGSYTIRLLSSTLETGGSPGDFVVIRLPIEVGNPGSQKRYVVLNGVGDSRSFSFNEESWGIEPVRVWYISETGAAAGGQATVVVE